MFVHVIGPNLPDQRKGSFHVHIEGCPDVTRNRDYSSPEFATDRKITIGVESLEDVVRYAYADQLTEGMTVEDGLGDFYVFPCAHGLPERSTTEDKVASDPRALSLEIGRVLTEISELEEKRAVLVQKVKDLQSQYEKLVN